LVIGQIHVLIESARTELKSKVRNYKKAVFTDTRRRVELPPLSIMTGASLKPAKWTYNRLVVAELLYLNQ